MRKLLSCAGVLYLCVVTLGAAGAHAQGLSFGPVKGIFLVATPRLEDPSFAKTVVLLLDVNESGALGLVVNRPSTVTLGRALTLLAHTPVSEHLMHYGGPVGLRQVYVLLRSTVPPEGAERIKGEIYVTTKVNALLQARDESWSEDRWRMIAGYAGWAPQQLQEEIDRGDWRVIPADEHSLFEVPTHALWSGLWRQLAGLWAQFKILDSSVVARSCASSNPLGQPPWFAPWLSNEISECNSCRSSATSTPIPSCG